MQPDCKNIRLFLDSHFVSFFAIAHQSIRQRLQKKIQIGFRDTPKSLQKTLLVEFGLGRAAMTALERLWALTWSSQAGAVRAQSMKARA